MSSTVSRRRQGSWTRAVLVAALAASILPAAGSPAGATSATGATSAATPAAGVTAVTAVTAALAVPAGLTPTGGAASVATPVLGWRAVAGATRYDVEVSAQPDFATSLYARSTTNTRIVPTVALPDGPVSWRVRAVGSAGTSAWSVARVTVGTTPPPTPTSPPNGGAPLAQPVDPPLLSWTSVQGATAYQIDVDVDGDFVGASTYTTRTTSFVVPDARADGTYHWRVRALLSTNRYTAYSPVWRYSIGPLAQVTPTTPEDGGALEDVVLAWDPVPGARTYDLQVSTDAEFNTIIDSRTNLKATRYSPQTTYLNDDYYWRVRARNLQGETFDWQLVTPIRVFQRNWLTRPTLLHPADALAPPTGDDLYLQWTPVPHATRYQLDLGTDPNFSPLSYQTCETASTTYVPGHLFQTPDRCAPTQGRVYYWRVRAIDAPANVQGIYSAIRTFVYSSDVATQTSPADGATVTVPTLEWRAARGAERYRVLLQDARGRTVDDVMTYSLSWTPSTRLKAADGPYAWSVQTVSADDRVSPRYAPRVFSVSDAVAAVAAAPTPVTPTGSGTRFPTLRWTPVAGAARYRVHIGIAGSGFFFENAYAPILSTTHDYPSATDTSLKMLSPATYAWQVEAFADNGASLGTGPSSTFTVAELPAVQGRRLALDGAALDPTTPGGVRACTLAFDAASPTTTRCDGVPTTPLLDWDPVPEAAYYMVYLSRDRELTNLVYPAPLIPRTTNTEWNPTGRHSPVALPDSQAGQAYYWFIRPCKAEGICGPDPVSTLAAATNAFSKTSPPVALTAPASGAQVADEVTFTWQDYLATNRTTTYGATGEVSNQAAMRYRVQVSQSRSFATLVDDRLVDQATYTAWDRTYPEGLLYWRVQAVDAAGNGLTWSVGDQPGQAGRAFRKVSPAPTLRSPVAGARTQGLTPFVWAPVSHAGSYQLEVYRNDDTNWSPSNRVVSVTSRQVAYANAVPFPASPSPYVWRVTRLDADNRPGAWSVAGRFLSTGAAPTPTSPTAGAAMSQTAPYFSWTAVPGAVGYRFERRAPGSTALSESVSTSAQAWAPTTVLAVGLWEWRVVAVDANRADLGASAWRSFTSMGALTQTPTPGIAGVRRVGQLLAAQPGTWGPGTVTLTYQWYRSGVAVTGARASTYRLTPSDLAKSMSVRVTGSRPAYVPVTRSSGGTAAVAAGTLTLAPTPSVAGTLRVGSRLSARPGTWAPAPVTLAYQWYRSGVAVRGATASTYLLTAADRGRTVAVAVTGRKVGYAVTARRSAATRAIA